MHCTVCDTRNPDDARFCVGCGARLEASPSAQPTPSGRAPVPAYTPRQTPGPMPTARMAGPALAPAAPLAPSAPGSQPGATLVIHQARAPGCLVRGLYFLFIGWWLGLAVTSLAWFMMLTIIGAPLGVMLLNRLPQVMTLQPMARQLIVMQHQGGLFAYDANPVQRPLGPRIVYFLLFGWWMSAIWLSMAWAIIPASLGLGLPIAFWMFNQTPAVVSLRR